MVRSISKTKVRPVAPAGEELILEKIAMIGKPVGEFKASSALPKQKQYVTNTTRVGGMLATKDHHML